jgi:hypothetical protein
LNSRKLVESLPMLVLEPKYKRIRSTINQFDNTKNSCWISCLALEALVPTLHQNPRFSQFRRCWPVTAPTRASKRSPIVVPVRRPSHQPVLSAGPTPRSTIPLDPRSVAL